MAVTQGQTAFKADERGALKALFGSKNGVETAAALDAVLDQEPALAGLNPFGADPDTDPDAKRAEEHTEKLKTDIHNYGLKDGPIVSSGYLAESTAITKAADGEGGEGGNSEEKRNGNCSPPKKVHKRLDRFFQDRNAN